MSLNAQQLVILNAAIEADPLLSSQPQDSDGAYNIAAAFNLAGVPDYIVWRTSVSVNEIMGNGFDWTRVDNLSVGLARIWEWMTQLGFINPSQANVRAGIDACFNGAANTAMRAAIYGHCMRKATRGEVLYATGTGTTLSPGLLTFEGNIELNDVLSARSL